MEITLNVDRGLSGKGNLVAAINHANPSASYVLGEHEVEVSLPVAADHGIRNTECVVSATPGHPILTSSQTVIWRRIPLTDLPASIDIGEINDDSEIIPKVCEQLGLMETDIVSNYTYAGDGYISVNVTLNSVENSYCYIGYTELTVTALRRVDLSSLLSSQPNSGFFAGNLLITEPETSLLDSDGFAFRL